VRQIERPSYKVLLDNYNNRRDDESVEQVKEIK